MPLFRQLRSVLHYLLVAVGGLLMALLLMTGLLYYIAVSDQERVPEIVEEVCRTSFGAEATFGHYRFQYLEHFPFLSLALEDVVMRDPCFEDHGRELLRVKKVSAVFRPWKLLRREFELRSISIDSACVKLYRDAGGYFNAGFLDADSLAFWKEMRDTSASFSIQKLEIRNLFFDFQDVLQGKRFRFEMRHSDIGLISSGENRRLQLQGQWFFHGLHFKQENGPYFYNQEGRLALNFEWGGTLGGIRLLPSAAIFGQDTLHLDGALEIGDTNHLRLAISSPGILLENARPLLAANLKESLKPFAIDRPVAALVNIEGPLLPGRPLPMEARFQADDVVFASGPFRFTHAALSGRYINNCNASSPITPHSDCLEISLDSALLFDAIAARVTYRAEDMKAPLAKVQGKLSAPLEKLNGLLDAGPFRFYSGQGEVFFSFSGRMDNPLSAPVGHPEIELKGGGKVSRAKIGYLPRGMQFDEVNAHFNFDEQNLGLRSLRFKTEDTPFQVKGSLYGVMDALLGGEKGILARLDVNTAHLDLGAFFSPRKQAPGSSRAGRNDILGRLDAELSVKASSLSYRKLQASDVRFTGRLENNGAGQDGPSLFIDSLSAVAFNSIPVRVSARLDELDDPIIDMTLQLATPFSNINPMLPPEKLRLGSGNLELQMHYQGRLREYSSLESSTLKGRMSGRATITEATADYLPRGYAFRRFNGTFHFDHQNLLIDSLSFILNGNQAVADGVVEGLTPFIFGYDGRLRAVLNLHTPELDLNHFPAVRRRLESGRLRPANPTLVTRTLESALEAIEGTLSVKAGKLHYRTLSLDEVAFDGRLLSADEGRQGSVVVDNLSGKLFGTAAFQSTLSITELGDPFFVADVQVEMPLEELNRMFPPGQFGFGEGKVQVGFHYEGYPHGHFDAENTLLKAHLKGEGQITGGAFEYKPRGYRFTEVDTRFSFDEKDLQVEDIRLRLNGNKMWGRGRFEGFLPFLLLPGCELETTLEVCAGEFDLNRFKAPQKFQQEAGKPQSPTVVTRLVNAGLENIHAHLHLDIDSVKYRNFRATEVKGELTMRPGSLRFEDTRMGLCDGLFRLNGRIEGLEQNQPDIDVQVQFENTDIHKVFLAFDNFGQQDLEASNIRGQLDAEISFSARANANYDLLPASMRGRFGVKVVNGALIGLPALDSLQSFLLRSRGLSNIQFATLENFFELRGRNLLVDHFFVASTALSFGVEGRYALGEGTDTDLLFEVPLANLFWQGKEVDALEKLHDKKRGLSILLRATEKEEGGLNFKWIWSKK